MPRESAFVKGRRLLTEGRVIVRLADARNIRAMVRGDSGEWYWTTYQRGGWACTCPALGRCSHLVALQLVTVRPGGLGA